MFVINEPLRIRMPKGYTRQVVFFGKNVGAGSAVVTAIGRDSFLLGYGQETNLENYKTESQRSGSSATPIERSYTKEGLLRCTSHL